MKRLIGKTLGVFVILCVLGLAILAGIFISRGYGMTVGYFLDSRGGAMLIDGSSPICLSSQGRSNMFDQLTNGDRVLVIHDGIAETYPAQTGAYICLKLSDGDILKIDQGVLNSLFEMGWYQQEQTKTVTCNVGVVSMSLELPGNWTSSVDNDAVYNEDFGIDFWPAGQEQQVLSLRYYADGFGTCGTGLESKKTTIAGQTVIVSVSASSRVLDHIYFLEQPGNPVIINRGMYDAWGEYKKQVMQITDSVTIQVDSISEERAVQLAKDAVTAKYDTCIPKLDYRTGNWTCTFYSHSPYEKLSAVTISADGQVLKVTD